MKFKILAGMIITFIAVFVATSKSGASNSSAESLPIATYQVKQTHKPLEKIKNNEPVVAEASSRANLHDLMGPINKEYGIREDILRYIEKEIPDNGMAKKAAIKYAQKWNFIYYQATPEEAMKEVNQQLITLDCLRYALKTDKPMPITKGIRKLMRNTPERDKYLWEISTKYFGWKIIEHDPIQEEKLKNICETGKY